MARVENPILWLKAKKARSDNPILWLNPKRHYAKFEETVSSLSDGELKKERARYNHNTRNDLTITALAATAGVGTAAVVGPEVGAFVLALSAGPIAAGACIVGITRGIFRDGEKEILQEEIERRQGATGEMVFSAPEKT